ncbi:MAG: TetR/AcrR family transcriptional regulator [Hylemonella sp.]|nr:TetR/AcrR family transcriptional regulator [Hylemonella sp.]
MTATKFEPDRRIQKTKTALRDAILTLMASKGWDDLGVQEICDQANVGRSTFYLHYQGKDDLLSEGMNDLRDRLILQAADLDRPGFRFLPGLLDHMAEQREVFRSVVGRRSGQSVARRFKEMVSQLVEAELTRLQISSTVRPWVPRYMAGGVMEAMSWWVDSPVPASIEALERELNELLRSALELGSR